MSDPLVSEAGDVVKSVGSGGGLLALGYMVVNIFKKKVEVDDEREAKALESVAAELKTLNTGVSEMKATLGILTERMSNVRADVDEIKAEHRKVLDRLSHIEGRLQQLSEGEIAR